MLDIIIQIDTREQNTKYVNDIKIDKRRNKDGSKIIDIEYCTVKPNTRLSTGDISFKYRKSELEEWTQSSFCIELKKGMDMFSSIYTASNYKRLCAEIDRAKEDNVDFYFVSTDDFEKINKSILKLRKFNENACKIYFDKYLKLNEYLNSQGYLGILTSGNDLGFIIRRLIKRYVINNKLLK